MPDRQPLRSNDIREQNEKLVLHLIYSRRSISQSEVVTLTGLKAPTVYRIFSILEQRGLIRADEDVAIVSDRKGRRPSPYMVNPNAHFGIGVDFWSRTAAVAVFDFAAQVLYQETMDFPPNLDADDVLDRITGLVRRAIAHAGIPSGLLLGIGVGAPGVVDIESGVVVEYERIRNIKNWDIKGRMEEQFSVPVSVHNNCSVIALGAHRYGPAQGRRSLVAFLIRAGLGGAFIHEGHLYVNQDKTAFEIGHFSLVSLEAPSNGMDRTEKTLEDYICEDSILQSARDLGGVEEWEDLDQKLQAGDPQVLRSLEGLGRIFSQAARNVSHLLNPEAMLIVSRSSALSAYFADSLTRHMAASEDSVRVNLRQALPVRYDPLLACRGAADLVFDEYFAIRH